MKDEKKKATNAKGDSNVVQKLYDNEMTSEKPLRKAEEELQMVIKAQGKVSARLDQQEKTDAEKEQHLETKYVDAKRHLRNAKRENLRKDFTADGVLTKEYKKKEAARKIVEDAKLAKIHAKMDKVKKNLHIENEKMRLKRAAIAKKAREAEELLDHLRRSEIMKTKLKITEAKIRHDRWKMRNLKDKATEAKLQAQDAESQYDELGSRLDHAQARYNKDKSVTGALHKRTQNLKEKSNADARHAAVMKKVAQMADHRYHEAKDEVWRAKKKAAVAKRIMRSKKDDFAWEQKSETNAIMEVAEQGKGALDDEESAEELGEEDDDDIDDLGPDDDSSV